MHLSVGAWEGAPCMSELNSIRRIINTQRRTESIQLYYANISFRGLIWYIN